MTNNSGFSQMRKKTAKCQQNKSSNQPRLHYQYSSVSVCFLLVSVRRTHLWWWRRWTCNSQPYKHTRNSKWVQWKKLSLSLCMCCCHVLFSQLGDELNNKPSYKRIFRWNYNQMHQFIYIFLACYIKFICVLLLWGLIASLVPNF